MHIMYTFPCKMPCMKARVHMSMQMTTTVISFQKCEVYICAHTLTSPWKVSTRAPAPADAKFTPL